MDERLKPFILIILHLVATNSRDLADSIGDGVAYETTPTSNKQTMITLLYPL